MKMTELERIKDAGVYVKVSYKDEIRKFKIMDYEKPYDDILNVLSHQYNLDSYSNKNIRLSYIDDDLDEITVSSNREVADALNTFHKSGCCIKLKIKECSGDTESGSESGDIPEPSTPNKDVPMEEAVPVKEEKLNETESLQAEIDKVINGIRGARNPNEENVIVANIFTTFQGKAKRQFEIENGMVVCKLCPSSRTMEPSVDLSVIKAHTKSDIHIMALTYHLYFEFLPWTYLAPANPTSTLFEVGVNFCEPLKRSSVLGEWPTLTAQLGTSDLIKAQQDRWRMLDSTAAQLLTVKYQQHLNSKPIGQRRKRTSFSPATTISLEKFANSIGWKRGESEKINEFAQKHGLTFYQVKVWMNNHRPRKNTSPANSNYTSANKFLPSVSNMYGGRDTAAVGGSVDHTKEINKVIAALEEPLKIKAENLVSSELAANPLVTSLGLNPSLLSNTLSTSPFALSNINLPLTSSLSLPTSLSAPLSLPSSLATPLSLANSLPTTLGLFHPTSTALVSNGGTSPNNTSAVTSPKSSPCISPFFSHNSRFPAPESKTDSASPEGGSTKTEVPTEAQDIPSSSFMPVPAKVAVSHPLSLDAVSLDSAFRPPSFTSNLHNIFTRQESTSSGS